MKRLSLIVLVLSFAITTPTIAAISFLTGNQLFDLCTSAEAALKRDASKTTLEDIPDWVDASRCAGFIQGVADSHEVIVETGLGKKLWCRTTGMTTGQLNSVILKFMRERPETLHESAASLVIIALAQAFPCE